MNNRQVPATGPYQVGLLKDIAEALNATYDISSAIGAILPRLSGVLGLQTAWAFRYDLKRGSFVEVGASGLPPALAKDNAAPLKSSWCECQERFVTGRLQTAVNIVRCSRLRDAQGEKNELAFHASIPLRTKDKPLGILNMAAAGEAVFDKESLDLLRAVGNQLAVAVDRAAMLSEAHHYSRQLQSLAHLAIDLATVVEPEKILTTAAQQFVDSLHFEACGIIRRHHPAGDEVVVKVVNRRVQDEPEYSYLKEPHQDLGVDERMLLDNARSVIMQPVLHTDYWVRLESSVANAFSSIDENIVSAFCGHVAAALENARLYAQSLQDAKWSERQQLAADLHDAVSQRLFSAQLLIRALSLRLPEEDAVTLLTQVQSLVQTSQQELRDLVQALRPTDARSFSKRIWDRLDPLGSELGLKIDCKLPLEVDQWITPQQDEAVCNVVDEAMQNVLKHALAHHVSIILERQDDRLVATITDDGVGFNLNGATRGFGLYTMRERMAALGGTFFIHTAPGHGTCLKLSLPLNGVEP